MDLGLYVWPRNGWLPLVNPDRLTNADVPSSHEGGHILQQDQITWIDTDGGVLCTCGNNSEQEPCPHGVLTMAYIEAIEHSQPLQAVDIERKREGISLIFNNVVSSLMESLNEGHPQDEDANGFVFGENYFHQHEDGLWIKTPVSAAVALDALLKKSVASSANRYWVPETAMPDILELSRAGGMRTASEQLHKYLTFANAPRLTYSTPVGLQAVLDPAQIEGSSWLTELYDYGIGGILADEMGVGKTMQVIAHILRLHERGDLERALICVPSGAVDHWMSEFKIFAPSLEILAWEGGQRKLTLPILGTTDIVITTHKLLTIDHKHFRTFDWTVFAIDEAQDGKNPQSELASSSALLPAKQKIPVTGTPVENSLVDLHTLFTIAAPGLLGRLTHFRKEISDKVKKGDEETEVILEGLHKIVAPFMMHRTQQSAGLSIPAPNTQRIDILLKSDLGAYETVRDNAKETLQQKAGSVFQLIMFLRQAAADYRLMQKIPRGKESTKTKWIADRVVEEINAGRQVLLFSTWTTHLSLLNRAIIDRGISPEAIGRIDGKKTRRERRWAEEDYKSGKKPLLEVTMRSGGRSLNLPETDTVILGVPWWNPSVMRQAAYRAVRRGQTKTIDVLIPIAEQTIEERLMEIQDQKTLISHSILKPSSGIMGLTMRELEGLINGS